MVHSLCNIKVNMENETPLHGRIKSHVVKIVFLCYTFLPVSEFAKISDPVLLINVVVMEVRVVFEGVCRKTSLPYL